MVIKNHKSKPNFSIEKTFWDEGLSLIAGSDEVGRGALAGPIVASSVIFSSSLSLSAFSLPLLNDSKLLSPKQREEAYDWIINNAISYSVVFIDNEEIDDKGIQFANTKAIFDSVALLKIKPNHVITDFFHLAEGFISLPSNPSTSSTPYSSFVKGDSLSLTIAAASIVAKVTRDNYMENEVCKKYPEYEFNKHKGYGTKLHFDKIKKFGICPLHRKSFLTKRKASS